MPVDEYKLVFCGRVCSGFDRESVRRELARLFRVDEQRAERLFGGRSVVIRRHIDLATARKYQARLMRIGADCEILGADDNPVTIHEGTGPDVTAPADGGDARMQCPRCGAEQPAAPDCIRCGVMVERYLAERGKQSGQPVNVTYQPVLPRRLTLWARILRACIIVPLIFALIVFVVRWARPQFPERYRFLAAANRLMETVVLIGGVVEADSDFVTLTANSYLDQAGALSRERFAWLEQHERARYGTLHPAIAHIDNAITSGGLRATAEASRNEAQQALKRLEGYAAESPEAYRVLLKGMRALLEIYDTFIAYSLYPERQRSFTRYHVMYRIQKGYVMAAFQAFLDALDVFRTNEYGRSSEKWIRQLKKAQSLLAAYRVSDLYLKMQEDELKK